ncbi:hypothetical protein F2P81_026084 [Scophthalmus maximus]|uniref:Uncharacterized protein n=1 Tax=Scophthalmus maximus TaxID=52904 RepID=A0A6A4RRK8_SCOMX|nr:hypothetical protein F2P81_026084 [Scophthalmus maximus]
MDNGIRLIGSEQGPQRLVSLTQRPNAFAKLERAYTPGSLQTLRLTESSRRPFVVQIDPTRTEDCILKAAEHNELLNECSHKMNPNIVGDSAC